MDVGERLLELCSFDEANFDSKEFMKLLESGSLANVDVVDKDGMTPLMHCAYRGHIQACQKLLASGADVNNSQQKDGYTALMFAAIAGKRQVVELLLKGGAKKGVVNNLGKTASTMAAFIGQHECAQVISNYLSLGELDKYVKPVEGSQRPRLSPSLVTPIHTLLVATHFHPVKVLLELEKEPALVDSRGAIKNFLDSLGTDLVNEQRENIAMKVHYLSFLIQLVHSNGISPVLSRMLTFSDDGKPVEMDMLLRQCLREFPHPHIVLLKQMVASLAKTLPGDHPNAYTLLVSVVLGDKGAMAVSESCLTCGKHETEPLKKCSRCKKAWYCSVQCQQLAWTKGNHKKLCKRWTTPTST